MAQLLRVNVCNKENKNMELMYNARKEWMILLNWIKHLVRKTLLSLSHQFQESLNGEKILMYLNQVCLVLILERTMTLKFIKTMCGDCIFTRRSETRYICAQLFTLQYKQMRKIFTPLCLKLTDRYYFNILRIIAIIYQIYIGYEIYNFAYITRKLFSMPVCY